MKTVKKLLLVVAAMAAMVAVAANRVIDVSDSEKIQIFDVPGNYVWTAPNNLTGTAQLLVVGGGGAGGGISGGGGGGGQVVSLDTVVLSAGQSYSIGVGVGGTGSTGDGNNGGDSILSGAGFETVTAIGGGGGAGTYSRHAGKAGANGGGGGGNGKGYMSGGAPTVAGGHYGAQCGDTYWSSAGGGGAGEDGYTYQGYLKEYDSSRDPDDATKKGYGGAGILDDITGTSIMYGYGGGAGGSVGGLSGAGNEWGKGNKDGTLGNNTPGEPGTGGGGGGGSWGGTTAPGGDGGSGTVIIRYTLDTAKDDFSANITRSIRVPTTVTFTAQLGTPLSEMTWNFGDGSATVTTTDLSVQHEYAAAGLYTVTMTHGSQIVTKTDYVEIISGVLYVDMNSTNPQPPYDTRATAAVKVTDALKYAENGFEVRIAPGEYQLNDFFGYSTSFQYVGYDWKGCSLPLFISNAVHIVGEGNSPTSVVIRSVRRRNYYRDMIAVVDNAGAFIENLTMADGSASNQGWGGSVWITANGGTVSNCVIRNGYANIPIQAKAGGAYLNAGLVTHTIFEDCMFNGSTYKDALGQIDLGTTRIASGAYVGGSGRVENCLFKNCTSDFGDVVAVSGDGASVINCTVVDGRIGYWTSRSQRNSSPITIGGVEYAKAQVIIEAITNDGYAVGCSVGVVKNCAVYNVKRVAYLDRPETYEAVFGPDAAKFTTCVAATKGDFQNYDAGKLTPAPFGALYNKGTEIPGFSGMKDLAGNDRVQGKAIDIGCYESPVAGMQIIIR